MPTGVKLDLWDLPNSQPGGVGRKDTVKLDRKGYGELVGWEAWRDETVVSLLLFSSLPTSICVSPSVSVLRAWRGPATSPESRILSNQS